MIYLLNQTLLIPFDLFIAVLRFLILFLDLNLNLLPEHFCQLYALILIVGSLECLSHLSVLVPLEDLLHLLTRHSWVLVNKKSSRVTLQVSHLLINFVEFSTYQLLLIVDTLANEENL